MQELANIKELPSSPGIYQYFSANGKLLYVGKAKDLKKRVRSYFSTPPLPNPKNSLRIQKMISEAKFVEYIITSSEANALILENSFIKQLNPKYNILLRDDKTYPYICLDLRDDFPRFEISRKLAKEAKVKYFGPFFKGASVLLDALYLSFKLRQKKSCKSPCLYYQIKRCKAPCNGLISKDEYENILKSATNALLHPKSLISLLEGKMFSYAKMQNFEEAAKMRDMIKTINELDMKIDIDLAKLENFDVYALACEQNLASFIRFIIQDGKLISVNARVINTSNTAVLTGELYKQFILENAMLNPLKHANTSYVYEEFEDMLLLENMLGKKYDKKYHIKMPIKGEKKDLVNLAYQNAVINIHKELKNDDFLLLKELKDFFELDNFPSYIEAFDNSHLQGSAPVGAMIAYKDGGFYKANYRHYHLDFNNDYHQMQSTLTTRAQRFDKMSAPDLWVIDGGTTLLELALQIVQSSGANIDVLAISKEKVDSKSRRAKGFAKDIIHSKQGSFKLNTHDKKLLFLQRLRDESHRFAITFHQKTKRRNDLASSALEKEGFSKAQIKKMLNYYGTFEAINKANKDERLRISRKRV